MYFNNFVRNRKATIYGAMSTALENLGYNTQSDLWTAGAIISHDLEVVAVGIDCTKLELVCPALRVMRSVSSKPPSCLPKYKY